MPTLNGWEFLEALRSFAKPQNTFVCVVSSSTDQVDIARADQNPYVLQYLSKPITVENTRKIKRITAAGRFLSHHRIKTPSLLTNIFCIAK